MRSACCQRAYDAGYKAALERVAGIQTVRDDLKHRVEESRRKRPPIALAR